MTWARLGRFDSLAEGSLCRAAGRSLAPRWRMGGRFPPGRPIVVWSLCFHVEGVVDVGYLVFR